MSPHSRLEGPPVDQTIIDIIDGAVEGHITPEDARKLLDIEPFSTESAYLQACARQLTFASSGGRALIYSQIGIDANPCPGNCAYCSFAVINNDWSDLAELSLDEILAYVSTLKEAGVHLVSLMTTANYDFEKYVQVVSAVREALGPEIAIMLNYGDMDLDQARRLKEAGGTIVYHAIRVGEGVITELDPAVRWATLDASIEAGLIPSSGVGPLYRGIDKDAVIERMFQLKDYDLICSGVTELHAVPGTSMEDCVPVNAEEKRIYACVWELVAGPGKAPFGGQNTRWIDAGANPRGLVELANERGRILDEAARYRKELKREGWTVPETGAFWELY